MAFMPTRGGRGPSTPIIFVPTLNDLVLSGALVAGVASTGTILNATTGSVIASTVPGLTVNSAARTYSYNGSGSVGSAQGLVETLAGATFSPRNNVVTVVSASIPAFTSNPSISPSNGDQNTTFTAIDGAMSNGGTVSARRWLLNGTSIGTGTTIVPGAPGSLVLENTGTGNVKATSTAVTVASTGTPTPGSSIGGVPIGTVATSGPETGMTLVYGDDFDGPLDLMGPAPAQRFGRYAPTRGDYLIYASGQSPRAAPGLGGVDADPYWTGHNDSGRGEAPTTFADMIVQTNSMISLRQRDMVAGEAAHVVRNNQNVLSSMIHGAFDVMVTAPFVFKSREQRFANNRDHMTTWFMNYMGFTRGDLEIDLGEAGSKKDGTGDGRKIEWNINAWDGVNRSDTDSAGSEPVTVDWSTPHVLAAKIDDQGIVTYYLDDVKSDFQYSKRPTDALTKPYHSIGTNHMYNVSRPSGVSRLEYDYWQWYVPGKLYTPKVAPILIQVAAGESKTVVLPSQAELWGETGLTEKLAEACMVEPNEPGGTIDGKFYLDLPSGVTLNESTRELTINVTTPGRLNIGRYVIKAGNASRVHRIAIEVGPVINVPSMINITQGVPFKLDLYPLVDCGILVTGNDGKRAKQVSVTGLPSDLPYSGSTYAIDGTPNTVGTRTLTVNATNSVGQPATKQVTLNVVAPAGAGTYAFESWPALVGNFDFSRDASYTSVTSGDFTTFGNTVANAGDLSKAPTVTPSPSRVPNTLNGKSVARFTKNQTDGAGTTVLESAQNATGATVPVAAVLTGNSTPLSAAWLVRFDVGSETCFVAGLSEQVSTTAARQLTLVKRDPATADSSIRYGANTASTADINIGRLSEGVWHLVEFRQNENGTSDVWVDEVRVVTAVAHTSVSAWTGTARCSVGNVQGPTNQSARYPSTGLAGELAQFLLSAAAQSDADHAQMRADIKTKWKYA
ncbi:hypothetical protein [Sphingomonas lacusdianchii]|uniref:hypothetical protein n=1 Tax=Sphingomonas lacusdianchii TaxID=2917992 RepID=UPI001F572D08|nr:hypothetical protein [Sphingomonas sp. JXJ CY 53]